jgi:hypothetical protein
MYFALAINTYYEAFTAALEGPYTRYILIDSILLAAAPSKLNPGLDTHYFPSALQSIAKYRGAS